MRVERWALLLGAALATTACSKKKRVEAEPRATSSASSAIAATLEAPARPKPALELTLVKTFARQPEIFQLSTGLVFCEDCRIGAADRADERPVSVFDEHGFRPMPWQLKDQQFAGFFRGPVSGALKQTGGGSYRFRGTEAAAPLLEIYGYFDDDGIDRNGALVISHRFQRVANGWQQSEDYAAEPNDPVEQQQPPRSLPREYDDALLHAPYLGELPQLPSLIAGGDGPLLIVDDQRLDYFDGKSWIRREVPFEGRPVARRLSDGRTLLLARGGLFVLDREAKASEVLLPDGTPVKSASWYLAGARPVFVVKNSVYAAADPVLAVLPPPKREDDGKRPEPPEPKTGIAKLSNFTRSCATPFVVLFNPPGSNHPYHLVAAKLAGHGELQDKLTFVELEREDIHYFGAQAEDEASARALIEAYQAAEPRAKPILGCLDAKSYVGDRYARRWDAKIVMINLQAGRWL